MAFPTTRESRTRLTASVSEIKVADLNYLMQLAEETEDAIGLVGDSPSSSGAIYARIGQLEVDVATATYVRALAFS